MTLEGNADERGSREYNVGLGERRGNAVSPRCRPTVVRRPDHRRLLRRRAPDLHRFQRRLLGPEPSRRNRLHREVSVRGMRGIVVAIPRRVFRAVFRLHFAASSAAGRAMAT